MIDPRIFFFLGIFILFRFFLSDKSSPRKVGEEFQDLSAEVEFRSRISNMLPMCLLANVSQGIISQPKIAKNSCTKRPGFIGIPSVYALIESSPVHFAFYSDPLERRAGILREHGTTLIVRITPRFIAYHLVLSKGKWTMWNEKDTYDTRRI